MPVKKKNAVETATVTEPKFSKEALVNSNRFHEQRDLISALLKDGAEYTIKEAEMKIAEYLKGKVK